MHRRSPTLEGFRLIFGSPSFGLAEIAWRWSFGAAFWLAIIFAIREYLSTLPVSDSDLLLLGSRQPALISQAIAHILRGSSLRVFQSALILTIVLTFGWIMADTLGRVAVLKSLLAHFGSRSGRLPFGAVLGIQFLRAIVTLGSFAAMLAAVLLAGAANTPSHPSPGSAMLIFLAILMFVCLAWSFLNWFLTLATVCATDCRGPLSTIGAGLDFLRAHAGAIGAVSIWFLIAHLTTLSIAGSLIAFPLAFATVLPAAVVLGGLLLLGLLFFGVVDFLYVGRLAAYMAIRELPLNRPVLVAAPLRWTSSCIDPDELILSDLPT